MSTRSNAPVEIVVALCVALWSGRAAAGEAPAPEPAGPQAEPSGSDDTGAPVAGAVPEDLVPPRRRNEVVITYPEVLAATEDPPRGTIVIEYVVTTDGTVAEITVVESVHPDLDAEAVAAIADLRFDPATWQGQAVEVVQTLSIEVAPPPKVEPAPVAEPAPIAETTPPEPPRPPVRMRGRLFEAGQRTPIPDATIIAVPAEGERLGRVPYRRRKPPATPATWSVQAVTGSDGAFELRGLPTGRVRVIVLSPGYERFESVLDVPADRVVEVDHYATRMNTNPYRTEVGVESDPLATGTERTVTAEESSKMPGTQGDALKSLQNLPGFARPFFGAGQLIIRGAAPGDSATFLAHHELPMLFHFGGITSVFNADLVDRMEVEAGNFDARYGDALGGIVDVTPRRGRRDGFHGYVDADIFDASAMMEGPVGKGSVAASVRRSYIDAILPAVLPDDAGFDLTVAPRYWDYQASFDYPVGNGELTARVLGSDDRARLVLRDANDPDPDARAGVESATWFHRADLAYETRRNRWSFLLTPSYRRDSQTLRILDRYDVGIVNDRISLRAETTRELGKRSALRMGTEAVLDWQRLDVTAPPLGVENTSARGGRGPAGGASTYVQGTRDHRFLARPAVYATLKWGIVDVLTLYPGARVTVYARSSNAVAFEPRLRAVLDATDTTTVTGAVGWFAQQPAGPETDPVFGNPNLRPEHALHSSLGVQQRFGVGWSVEVTGFHKYLYDLAAASPEVVDDGRGGLRPVRFDNAGRGRAYGGELLLRKDFGGKLYGWLAYTVSRSEIRQRPGEDYGLFDFDQTHILTAIVGYRLPRNWQVGARFRLLSGTPITPRRNSITQLYDGAQLALEGDWNSGGRQAPFHQLDLRVDKTWTFRLVRLGAYLDVQNLYNAKNPELTTYSWNYQESQPVSSLPIIPSLGLKLEW